MRIYEVELFNAEMVGAPRSLPARVVPLPDEALASWLLRFADPFGISPEALLLGDGECDLATYPEAAGASLIRSLSAALAGGGRAYRATGIRLLSFAGWPWLCSTCCWARCGSYTKLIRALRGAQRRLRGSLVISVPPGWESWPMAIKAW